METVFPVVVLVYLIAVFVLPIGTASSVVRQRTGSWWWSLVIAFVSLVGGGFGFLCAATMAARSVPPGHELLGNPWGMVGAFLTGMVLGLPIGTWSGAWGCALLILR